MNPVNSFSGQQLSAFASPTTTTTLQTNSLLLFGQPSLFRQNNALPGKSPAFSQVSSIAGPSGVSHSSPGVSNSSSAPTFGLTQTSSAGHFSGVEPPFVATSGPSSSSVPGNTGFTFKLPSSVGVFPSGSNFGPETGEVGSSGFRKTEFSFKLLENALFRPVLGAEAETEKAQSQVAPGFFTFSHPVSSGSGGLTPFSFPQVTSSSSFIFSKPISSNSSSAFTSTLSNQNTEAQKRGPKTVFGSFNSSFASSGSLAEPFPGSKTSVRQGCEEALSQVNPRRSLMKGLKRKEDQDHSPRRHGHKASGDSDPLSRGDHPPHKRPVRLNRPRGSTLFGRTIPRGGTLFSRTLQDVFKSNKDRLGTKESKKESVLLESGESELVATSGGRQSILAPSRLPGVTKEEETESKDKRGPNKKLFSLKKPGDGEASQGTEDTPFQRSPLCKPIVRAAFGSLRYKSSPVKKPSLLKFEGDPVNSGSEVLGSCVSSLSTLIGTVAETSEEKYRVLDRRDRIMRQARVKRTDLNKARPFVGTCPDMCPEKERYMRETRSQLSMFEVIPGTDQVDHKAAVKEYSRSSADQEEPLPHELRPSAVLSRTMDYLVTQIMDQKEGSLRDWYDFVWNRTRSIRKDITQQNLCDPLTVSLIEKCTRFHIHCAHFMCEEPMSSFDAKINNENMTKCLQSLKEMYQDLRNKNVFCTSEAEFQGYNVLLNLNKGDILREVQQFHPDVRNSPEVDFAVQAFAALNSNNFVRFFKLVQSASYLSACLLHFYFNQIRKDALRALNVAYTVSTQRSTFFPLDVVVRVLLFRDSEEATDFLNYHGLTVADGCVELNRSAFLEPRGLSKARKSVFITRKLMVSVGEVVNGGPLPPVPRHTPVCSFNSQNKYIGESLPTKLPISTQKSSVDTTGGGRGEECEAELDVPPLAVLPQSLPAPASSSAPVFQVPPNPAVTPSLSQPFMQPEPLPPKPPPVYSDADLVQVVDELIQETLQKDCEEVCTSGAAYVATALSVSDSAMEDLITAATMGILRHVATEEVAEKIREEEEKRQAEEKRLKQERELMLTHLSQSLAAELTELMVTECVWETCSQELKHAVEVDQRVRMAHCCEDVCTHLVDLFLAEEIFQAAKEALQELQCFYKCLKQWRETVAARKKLRRQMWAFPAAPCCVDVNDQLRALVPSAECPITPKNLADGLLDLGHAGKVGISYTRLKQLRNKTAHQMKVQHFHQQLLSDAAWAPLDLPSLVAEHLPVRHERVFWKLVLVLPDGEEQAPESPGRILANWLKVKLIGDSMMGEKMSNAGEIETLTISNALSSKRDQTVFVNVCVKVVHGTLSEGALDAVKTQKDLLGASGLMLLLPPKAKTEDVAKEDVYWLSVLLPLKQLLQAKPFQPALPLVIFVPSSTGDAMNKEAEDGLMLQDLVSAKLISDYIVVEIPNSVNDLQGTMKVSGAVQWLLSHCPHTFDLCCQTLIQYVEDGVGREFSGRFFHDRRERHLGGLTSQEPSAIIELFNSVLQFLASVVSCQQLCDLSWPVAEFAEVGGSQLLPHLHWNLPEHLAWLKQAVLGFQLPQMDLPPPGAPWLPVCSMVVQYASQIPSSRQAQPVLQSQMENLLFRTYQRWKSKNPSPDQGTGPSVADIPWDDIITLCINHKLRDWTPPRIPVTSEALSNDGQICAYFFKNDLKNYNVPLSWKQARGQTWKELQLSQGRLGIKSFHPSASSFPTPLLHVHHKGKRNAEHGQERNLSAKDLMRSSSEELMAQCLSSSLLLEKEENKRFEEQLQQWLSQDPGAFTESTSLPLYLPQTLLAFPHTIKTQTMEKMSTTTNPQTLRAGEQMKLPEVADVSLTQRLKHLERLIQSSHKEEVASELHLSALVDMVDI